MKKILIVIFSILIALPTLAEENSTTDNNQNTGTETVTISGTIVGTNDDSNNETLPNANILVLGANNTSTTTGTISGQNGTFTLQNVPSDASIQISYVGYEPETIPVSKLKNNNEQILLKQKVFDDVEVIGEKINNTLTRQYSPTTTEQESTKQITTRNQAPINEDLPPPTDTGGLESEPQPTLSEEDQKILEEQQEKEPCTPNGN